MTVVDRWGQSIRVGWSQHELLWVKAALSMDVPDRAEAFQQIALMTKRPLDSVRKQARKILMEQQEATTTSALVSLIVDPPSVPSAISVPDKRRLMAGR